MDNALQHWKILWELGPDLISKVREFMVICEGGDGVMVATDDGQGFWYGTMMFEAEDLITTDEPTQLNVPELIRMAQGHHHILLLNKRGEIYSMGQNKCGQLGLGTEDDETRFSAQLIPIPDTKFISVRGGYEFSMALTNDGKVWAWGDNQYGQVGLIPESARTLPTPHQIPEFDPHPIVAIECGGYHSLALTDQGVFYSWGGNTHGQLGDGSLQHEYAPNRIIFIQSPLKSIAAGLEHTLLLTRAGEVYSCGWNGDGQLGCEVGTTESPRSPDLVKVKHLSVRGQKCPISHIAAHFCSGLSIAFSSDEQRCFVWGSLAFQTSSITPKELPSFYNTVDSPFSYYSLHNYTPHSVSIPETLPTLSSRMSRMFDNPETSDVQFVVEQRTIHAHRCILSNSSDYFARMFSETWLPPVDPEDPIVRVTIPDHSYEVFHTFLCLIYTDCYEVINTELLPELFDLSTQYLVPDLQKNCLNQMRTTISPTTCCLYYPLTHRHPLPELFTFQQDLVQFISTRTSEVYHTPAYQSMDGELCKQLSISIASLPPDRFP